MTENEAKVIARELYANDEFYIMLSVVRANMRSGYSVPYVGRMQDGSGILFVFTSYDELKKYMDECKYEVLDNVYTIGRIKREERYTGLIATLNNALHMGIHKVDFNPGTQHRLGCNIEWFFNANELSPEEPEVLLSEEETQNLLNNEGQVPVRFNAIPIYQFEDRYTIEKARAQEVLDHVFAEVQTYEELLDILHNQETLHENCFVAEYLNTQMIPAAKNANKQEHVEWFMRVNYALADVIWNRLEEHELYTLIDCETKELMIRQGSLYVLYTDLFKYMGQYGYRKISRDELLELIDEYEIKRLIVTDGPHSMAMVTEEVFNS